MMPEVSVRPPYDPALEPALASLPPELTENLTADGIDQHRKILLSFETDVRPFDMVCKDYSVPGFGGAEIVVSVYTPRVRTAAGPAIFNIHGGGMIGGNRHTGIGPSLTWAVEHDAVVATVEYRLAPEFPDPIPVEDCYLGLVWFAEHSTELGFDPDRILAIGARAGGGLAAGTALMSRDRGGPPLLGQMLMCPMLDDRNDSVSARQFESAPGWSGVSNTTGWTALLGDRRGGSEVSAYGAPARATDLSRLPPTFIDVGSAEVFRDEAVAFASGVWAHGGIAELHVWPGGYHGFDQFVPDAAISVSARATRATWVGRLFSRQ